MITTSKVPADFKVIAEKYAFRNDVIYLRPIRMFLQRYTTDVARYLGITWDRLASIELLRRPMERELYNKYECYLIDHVKEHKVIPPGAIRRVERTTTHRIHTLARFLKQVMTPSRILRWKRDLCNLTSTDLCRMVGYSPTVVNRCLWGYHYTREVYEALREALNKCETQKLADASSYDNYY